MNNEIITIKDMTLALLLQEELKKQNKRNTGLNYNQFTKEELFSIKKLKISNSRIRDISELEYCINLRDLEITSVVAKKVDIPLEKSYNYDPIDDYNYFQIGIKDFSPISKFKNLEFLLIENVTSIEEIDLSSLQKLCVVTLKNNQNLKKVVGLEKLPELTELELFRNNIKNSIELEEFLINGANNIKLDFDLYPNIVNTNSNMYEIINKYRSNGCTFKFLENLSGYKTNEILPIKMNEMHQKAVQILKDVIKDDYSEMEKVAAIYYYLIKNIDYDWERLNASKNGSNIYSKNGEAVISGESINTDYNRKNSSYNGIMEGKAVCEGYTNMMHYLLNIAGIDSRTVSCNMGEENVEYVGRNSNHSIIRINIGGGWYYFDPTNDKIKDKIKFFMKTKDEISKTHVLSMDEVVIENVEHKSYDNTELGKIFNYIAGYSSERLNTKVKKVNFHLLDKEQKINYAKEQIEILKSNDPLYKYYCDILSNYGIPIEENLSNDSKQETTQYLKNLKEEILKHNKFVDTDDTKESDIKRL